MRVPGYHHLVDGMTSFAFFRRNPSPRSVAFWWEFDAAPSAYAIRSRWLFSFDHSRLSVWQLRLCKLDQIYQRTTSAEEFKSCVCAAWCCFTLNCWCRVTLIHFMFGIRLRYLCKQKCDYTCHRIAVFWYWIVKKHSTSFILKSL